MIEPAPMFPGRRKEYLQRSVPDVAEDHDGSWRRDFVAGLLKPTDTVRRAETMAAMAAVPPPIASAVLHSFANALAFLLAAEVVAATAVVSEAALIYVARFRNLVISIATIALQACLTVLAMVLIDRFGLPQLYRAAAAALSLALALGAASVTKAFALSRILGRPINNWRWALIWAAALAIIVGEAAILLPEWAELIFGIPAILGAYGWVIWRRGFGPEDRMLFRRTANAAVSEG